MKTIRRKTAITGYTTICKCDGMNNDDDTRLSICARLCKWVCVCVKQKQTGKVAHAAKT